MTAIVPYALGLGALVAAALFRLLPGRVAAAVALVGGWAILPVAVYTADMLPEAGRTESPMHALALPTAAFAVNKATALGLGCLVGAVLFDWAALRRLRFSWLDLPVVVWCLVPLLSAPANGLGVAEGLAQARYNALAWGVPYLMGRAYFADAEGLRVLAIAWALAGLAYVPLCLAEFLRGPFLYDLVYGPHPYRLDGADRPIGHRPLVFLEHGNQLGMWAATAAAAAVGLWRSGRPARWLGMPAALAAAVLVVQALACQSLGAIVLLLLGLPVLLLAGRVRLAVDRRVLLGVGAVAVVAGVALITAAGGPLRSQARGLFRGIGKESFTWRLARYEDFLPEAARRPLIGHARADWSPAPGGRFVDPAALGLWMLAFGMYGAAGSLAALAALPVPAARALARRSPALPELAAAVLLAMNAGDLLFNSTLILPLLALAGGLAGAGRAGAPADRAPG